MKRTTRYAVAAALLLAAGCAEGDATAGRMAVRDSAGVQIVESQSGAWEEGEGWRLSAEPTLRIGALDGPADYQFDRVIGAVRRSDGGIAVADMGLHTIRFYDATGSFISATGRKGGGPGEFERMDAFQLLPGDSLLTFDLRLRRVSIFTGDGSFVRSVNLKGSPDAGFPRVMGRLGDGSLLVSLGRVFGGPDEVQSGLSRNPVTFVRFSAEGELLDTIATLPGNDAYVKTQDRGFTVTMPLFGRTSVQAFRGDRVVLGSNDAYELGVYSPAGALQRVVRRSQAARPVTDADWDALLREKLDDMEPEWRKRIEPMYAEMPRAATMPFYSGAQLDDAGNLWVQDFRAPGDAQTLWTVFDAESDMLGGVPMPEGFRPTHIGDDFVLGVWTDELDVQYVQMFALDKGE
jgi:hypothetical protein